MATIPRSVGHSAHLGFTTEGTENTEVKLKEGMSIAEATEVRRTLMRMVADEAFVIIIVI